MCLRFLSECCSQSVKYAWVCEREEDYTQKTRDRVERDREKIPDKKRAQGKGMEVAK